MGEGDSRAASSAMQKELQDMTSDLALEKAKTDMNNTPDGGSPLFNALCKGQMKTISPQKYINNQPSGRFAEGVHLLAGREDQRVRGGLRNQMGACCKDNIW